jgi:hypoxia-inducible factor 1 alpha
VFYFLNFLFEIKISSGVENKDEIYSCAQLAAQQTEHQPHRKQQQQHVDDIVKKEIVKSDEQLSIEVFASPVLVRSRPSPVLKPALISPPIISGVPISNTNIRRPRSVTAAIFASAQVEKPVPSVQQQQHHQPPIRGQSVTAKLFAASPSLSSLTAAAGQHQQQQARPQNATSKIFVPRTEDMNKGYYMYCEEDTGLTSEYYFLRGIFGN